MKALLQEVVNNIYRYPKAHFAKYNRFGGYLQYRKMLAGEDAMRKAANTLPPMPSFPDGLPVFFLTGEKFIHQTLFCIRSLIKVSNEKYHFLLIDDGSFTDGISRFVFEKLPGATLISKEQIDNNLNKNLPADKFPSLHHKRKVYPHIKKLTDVHTIDAINWKLVLDSDMLFWNEPTEMINWLKQPRQPIHMVDCEESYGYSSGLMSALSGADIPALINVGAIGLNSRAIKWDNIENWIKELEEREGTSYYLEQALTAMIIGQTPSVVLNKDAYKVNPGNNDMETKANILHHYVDLSKEIYFKKAWHFVV
jgi:hypothetical protein